MNLLENETVKKVRIDYSRIKDAESIEDILCLAVLITKGKADDTSTIEDSRLWYKNQKEGCNSCPFNNVCLACIINE